MKYFKSENWVLNDRLQIIKIILHSFLWLLFLLIFLNSFGTIGAGKRGVLLQFGAVQDKIFNEGIYFKIPFVQQIEKIDVRTQKEETNEPSASKDLQQVS